MIRQLHGKLASRSTIMVLSFLALYFIWGSTYLAIHIASETMPPLTMLGARFGVAGLIMLGWLKMRGKPMPTAAQWRSAIIVGFLMLCLGTGSVALSMKYIPTGMAALLLTTVPLWMVLFDWLWKGGAKPSPLFFAGFALGLLGVFFLIDPQTLSHGFQADVFAILAVIGGAMSWSIGALQGKSCNMPENPVTSTAVQMIGGGLTLVLTGFLIGERVAFVAEMFTLRSMVAWGYLVIFGSFIAFSAFIWLMRNTTPARVTTYAYVNPVVAIYLGWALAGEEITSRILLASMFMITAVVIVIRYGPSKQVKPVVSTSRLQTLNPES